MPRGTTLCIYEGHSLRVWAVAWSPGGTHIASGGDDGTVQVWDAATGDPIFMYLEHANSTWVRSVSWSPDGRFIASGGGDGIVRVWEAV